jgi:hypothetical protein
MSATVSPTPTGTPEIIAVYPNPYSPTKAYNGTLKFDFLPPGTKVVVYDIQGYKVAEFDGVSGRIEWNGENMNAEKCAAGIYMYIVTTESNKYTGKIYIIK